MTRRLFHLSIPVADLSDAKRFYVETLDAVPGRESDDWVDVWLWGHQLTLHRDPGNVRDIDGQGRRHFGTVLSWESWQAIADRLAGDPCVLGEPVVAQRGTPQEQAKLYLKDPSNNVIELKAYRDVRAALGADGP